MLLDIRIKDKCDLPDAHTKMQEINDAWESFQSYDPDHPNRDNNEDEREVNRQNYQNNYEQRREEEEFDFEEVYKEYERRLDGQFECDHDPMDPHERIRNYYLNKVSVIFMITEIKTMP